MSHTKQAKNKGPIKLHIGCGDKFIPGFLHIDVRRLPHIDHIASADKLSMFKDNSVDHIYACHVLEHFPRNKTDKVLQEWYRVLKPKGTLRVCVPDFEKLISVYKNSKDIKTILGPLVGRQNYPENTHYMVFDLRSLREMLRKTGFKNIKRYDWRKTIHKDYDDFSQAYIPHMDKEKGVLISLNVECVK